MATWGHSDRDEIERLQRRVRDMEYEAEAAREQRDREYEREQRRQDEQRRERQEWMHARERHVDTWEEAFRRQITLLHRELNQELVAEAELANDPDGPQNAFEGGAYWRKAIAECETAQAVWNEAQAEYEPRMSALRQQMTDLDAEMRRTVGERVTAATDRDSTGLVDALNRNDPDSWLDW